MPGLRRRSDRLVLLLALLASVSIQALEEGLPSKTAIYVLVARAIGAKNPDPADRNPDYLAIQFLGPRERAILTDYPVDAVDLDFEAALKRLPSAANVTTQMTRTKFFDGAMLDAVRGGATQVVVLGAGFDSRAYRFTTELARTRFFEVDSPPTQQYKIERVRQILPAIPSNVRYVPMDFTKDDLLTELKKAGYSESARTFFLWEGVTVYLPEAAVQATLHFVRDHSPARSTIAFDYQTSRNTDVNNPGSQWARWGEPWIFGFPGDGAADYVKAQGLDVISDSVNARRFGGNCIARVRRRG